MDEQGNLFLDDGVAADFAVFDMNHPEVYRAYCDAVDELIAAGCTRYGSQGVFWQVRWQYAVNPEKDEGFKIPNKYSPHYARKWLSDHPQHPNFFETRTLKV